MDLREDAWVFVDRIGFTVLKGARFGAHESVQLSSAGPAADRLFCLVDEQAGRVLRTVQNPRLMRVRAAWSGSQLTLADDLGEVTAEPTPVGEPLALDYWGRSALVQRCDGPWTDWYSTRASRRLTLCRSMSPGETVYGASVSLVTTSSMRRLVQRHGRHVASERFRSTFVIDTGDAAPHVEDAWAGRSVRIGEAVVRVRGQVPRCGVINMNPVTGIPDARILHELATYRQRGNDIGFGVDAVVASAGVVSVGATVEVLDA